MTYKEAANRIELYMKIHCSNAAEITEALQMATNALRKFALTEECVIQKGTPVWYVDFEDGLIEKGTVFSVQYKNQKIDGFSVEFEDGDFDEFYGSAIGRCFFLDEKTAEAALRCGEQK